MTPHYSVSIHAPARGATKAAAEAAEMDLPVSIHAPARGATNVLICRPNTTQLFQSTHPHGVRRVPMFSCY